MKILFLINEFERGGAERVVSYLLSHFQRISAETKPILFILEQSEYAYPLPDNIELYVGSKYHSSNIFKFLKIPLLALRLKRIIKKRNVGVVISFLTRANFTNILSGYFGSGHRCITSERITTSLNYHSRHITDIINRLLIRILYPSSQTIIAVSKGVRKDLVENFNISEDKVSVIYNPYDIDDIKLKSMEEVKHKWLNNKTYKTIISVGRMDKQKNHALLIRAFKHVNEKQPETRLLIIGEGSERDNITKLINVLALESKVQLLGRQKNPFAFLSKADQFVLSSDFEGFPNALVEAMICGCPVISTNCQSGPDEIITDGVNGLLVPVGNIKALSNAIITTLKNEQLRTELKNKAEESIQIFDITKIVKEYKKILIQNSKYR